MTTPPRPPVAIVMLTWNALAYTKSCLAALRDVTDHPAWRLVVVDNGSTDGTVEWLRGLDWVSVIENEKNLGFTKGCNIGIEATRPDEDVVLMNNDVLVDDPSWLSALQDVALTTPDTGIVGARLVSPDGTVGHLGSYMPPLTLWGQQMGGTERDINQATRDRPVEAVVFAQAYITRTCLERIGLLDEEFFAYYEDSDYCLRAERAGIKVMFSGRVTSVHHNNVTTRENGVDFWSMFDKSKKIFRRKWARWLEDERYEGEVVWNSVMHRAPGYAIQSRKMMEALHFAGMKVSFRNAYGDVDQPTDSLLVNDILKRKPNPDAPNVVFAQADVFQRASGRRRVGWTMLEVTGLPVEWVDGCNAMDEVWVPASFNLETFRRSGVQVPLRLMPLGVDADYFHPGIAGFRPTSRFTFLSVFEWGERKGAELLLRAFSEEFDESDDVALIVSVYNRDPGVHVYDEVAKLDLHPRAPLVVLLNAEFAPYQMGSLYRSADCFVLPTRGEGWGMPVLEAMACGLPAIATAWSGPADFLTDDVGYPLQVKRLIKARAKCPYYTGFDWADPDFDHLRFLMRHVYEHPDEARAKAATAAELVRNGYTIEHAAERVKARLLELG
jgi:GT2 family glycosyltransferase